MATAGTLSGARCSSRLRQGKAVWADCRAGHLLGVLRHVGALFRRDMSRRWKAGSCRRSPKKLTLCHPFGLRREAERHAALRGGLNTCDAECGGQDATLLNTDLFSDARGITSALLIKNDGRWTNSLGRIDCRMNLKAALLGILLIACFCGSPKAFSQTGQNSDFAKASSLTVRNLYLCRKIAGSHDARMLPVEKGKDVIIKLFQKLEKIPKDKDAPWQNLFDDSKWSEDPLSGAKGYFIAETTGKTFLIEIENYKDHVRGWNLMAFPLDKGVLDDFYVIWDPDSQLLVRSAKLHALFEKFVKGTKK